MKAFPFKIRIEQLVQHLDSLISNVEYFSSEVLEQASQELNTQKKINHILSCQIVNFGSEAGKLNNYDVYNYCHTLLKYEKELEKHFNIKKNKSILSIKKGINENVINDDGIWYSKRAINKQKTYEISLEYSPRTTQAFYEVYNNDAECNEQWINWRKLMFSIYEDANSVFSKNIRIEVTDKKNLYSGIYITFACRLNYRQIGVIGRICETFLNDIAFQDLIPNLHKNIQSHALQSAVAQVFARNFAYNIGSHVAIRATNRMAKERIAELYKIDKLKFKDYPSIENWLDFMGEKLDLFEVARNEFLAEYKLPAKNAMLYRDVILPFCENTLLMDNIAHSENVHYGENGISNKLKIKVLIKGSNERKGIEIKATYPHLKGCNTDIAIIYPDNFPYLVQSREIEIEGKKIKYSIDDSFANKSFTGTNDIEICLTNEHTIYSILENLIRNSAKHNKDKLQSQDLLITINIEDTGDDDYYKIQVYDNISKVSEEQLNKFAKSIAASLITNDGEIQKESLGIADIKINAHLLKTDADITNANLSQALMLVYQKNGSKIFKEYITEENPSKKVKYNFGYQFKLCKPKKVVWIGKTVDDNLKKKGIICIKDYKHFKPEGQAKTEELLANYQFAVLELDAVKDLTNGEMKDGKKTDYEWDDFLIKLPHRVFLNCRKTLPAIKELIDYGRIQLVNEIFTINTHNENWDFEFLKTCWENWLRKWVKDDEKARLIVYFENNQDKVNEWEKLKGTNNFLNVDFFANAFSGRKIESKDKYVIYDHHSQGYINIVTQEGQNLKAINFINDGAYLQFSKSSIDFVDFFYPKGNEHSNQLFLFQAFCAGQNKIVVVDERICEMLDISDDNTKKVKKEIGYNSKDNSDYADLANNGNVFIVTKFLDDTLNSNFENFDFSYNGEPILKSPNFLNIDNEDQIEFDALIIHRTFLIKLFEKNKDTAQKLIMHQLYQKFKRVIVVSGGGYPHSIEKFKISFKPYSQLKNCFIQYPSKIALSNLI